MLQITSDNFQYIAARCYKKRLCFTPQSFRYDIAHLDIENDVKKYFADPSNQMIRMVLNQMIIACNLFGAEACDLILFKLRTNHKYYILVCHLFDTLGIMTLPFEKDKELQEKINEALR